MRINDVVTITKSAIAQALGDTYAEQVGTLTPTNSSALVSLGQQVTSQSQFTELFMNGVIDQMAKVEIENETWEDDEFRGMMVSKEEYGGFLARIYFEPTENFFRDPSFNPENGHDYSAMEHTYYGTPYSQRIFTDSYDLLGAMSYSQEELLSAFKDWDEMNSFLTAKRAIMRTMLNVRFNVWKHALAQGAIALSVKNGTARHLLTEFNALYGTELVSANCLHDAQFLSYMSEQISNDKDYIKGFSSAYTNGDHVTFSTKSNLWLIKAIESRIRFGLRADTFNERLVSFGDYETVKYWQAIKDADSSPFDMDVITKVSLDHDACVKYGITDTEEDGCELNNVVALMCDWRSVGIAIKREYANASQTAVASFNTQFNHVLSRGLVDDMYPIIAYLLD